MKIFFFGTSEFAIPVLKKLFEASVATPHPRVRHGAGSTLSPFKGRGVRGEEFQNYEIVAVVTQPDKPAGRKQEPLPSPVKVWALEHGLKVVQPTSLKAISYDLKADLFIVASYGQIIPKQIFDLPKYGTLNIHPSLLPKYRGPSPIHAAILNGDSETGVTIIKLDEELDHGSIIAECRLLIAEWKPYYRELHDKLAELAAKLLIKTLPKYVSGEIKPIPQDHSKATFTKIITKDDAKIDWTKPAEAIERQVRAFHVWPVAWTTLDGKRLKILKALKYPSPTLPHKERGISFVPFPPLVGGIEGGVAQPGTIMILNQKLLVHCGQGVLEIEEVQLEGRKKMSTQEFLRGFNPATTLLSLK